MFFRTRSVGLQHTERDECGVVYEFTCEVSQVETVIPYAVVPDGGSLELRDGSKVGHPFFREMKQPREVIANGGSRTLLEINCAYCKDNG